MAWDRTSRVLMFVIKLRQLLTGEGYVLLKTFGDSLRSTSWFTVQNGVKSADKPTASLIRETKNDEKILDLTRKIIELLTGEIPIRYEDTTVFFTREEWNYVEEHKILYKDILIENNIVSKSIGDNIDKILHSPSLEKVRDSKTSDRDKNHVAEKILHLIKELIDLLTKEKYIVIWTHGNVSTPEVTDDVSGLIKESSRPSLTHEKKNDGEILYLTNKIIELLTGEALIRYEDITVHFSVDEWEYIEEHKDLYKDIMMNTEILQSYDKPSSVDCTEESPLEFHKHGKDSSESSCVLTGPPPQHTVKSTKCFHKPSNIKKHKKKHTEQTPVLCSECGKEFKRSDVGQIETDTDSIGSKQFCEKCLLDHRNVGKKKRPFPCTECGCSFSIKGSLDAHLRMHTFPKNFPCSECDKVFPSKNRQESHMKVHTGEKPHQCSECGKCFCNSGNLQAHYRVHTGERPFPCTECDRTFRYKSHLVAHQRFHTGQTLLCPECGKSFVYQSHFEKHLRIHTGEKPYGCPECGKCFKRRFQLREHVMIHTGESFKCEECDKPYRFLYNLLRHQQSHAGEKPFSCAECGKGFLHSASLTEHKMIHTGEKPYSCPECGKLFISSKYMLRHQKTHIKKK
ncbi:zinc finger protein 883-like isoform X1 [Ranitomeya imitator]|uniref:zinc finger protein 883-like isoform X1 n=1 Tax=Ranitomeya imitator TaxID=111125 RepID=UPI0037E92F81